MLKPDGNVTLIDFGTAREFKETSVADTTCLGTRGYAAPEQFGGQGQTDARTDIYCLGATLYHLLTGHNPAEPPYEMYPIRKWNPLLSSGLEQIIAKCTQQNPEDRYQSCAELMYDLQHYKELDIESQKQYRKSWRIFVGSCVMTVMCLAGAVGCYATEKHFISENYDMHIKEGDNAVDYKSALEEYKLAIEINPGEITAYEKILEKTWEDSQDGDSKEILQVFNVDNLEAVKDKSEKNYAVLEYAIGVTYYAVFGEHSGDKNNYFENALSTEKCPPKIKECAELMKELISHNKALESFDPDEIRKPTDVAEIWDFYVEKYKLLYEEDDFFDIDIDGTDIKLEAADIRDQIFINLKTIIDYNSNLNNLIKNKKSSKKVEDVKEELEENIDYLNNAQNASRSKLDKEKVNRKLNDGE